MNRRTLGSTLCISGLIVSFIVAGILVVYAKPKGQDNGYTVVGTGDPDIDIPAVQDAVDSNDIVYLEGTFHFGDETTPYNDPSAVNGAGTVVITRNGVTVTGIDGATIFGGYSSLTVRASDITVENLHFDGFRFSAVQISKCGGVTTIRGNLLVNGLPGPAPEAYNLPLLLNGRGGDPIQGDVLIEENEIDVFRDIEPDDGSVVIPIAVFETAYSPHVFVRNNIVRCTKSIPARYSAGIDVGGFENAAVIVEGNSIESPEYGVRVRPHGDFGSTNDTIISKNTINMMGPAEYAIGLETSSNSLVERNVINVVGSAFAGIYVHGSENTVRNNKIIAETIGYPFYVHSGSNNIFLGNNIAQIDELVYTNSEWKGICDIVGPNARLTYREMSLASEMGADGVNDDALVINWDPYKCKESETPPFCTGDWNPGIMDHLKVVDGDFNVPTQVPRNAVTIAAWVNVRDTGDHHEIFNARATSGQWVFHPEIRNDYTFRWTVKGDSGALFTIYGGSWAAGPDGFSGWIHFAGTYDRSLGKAILYINVVQVGEADSTDLIAADWEYPGQPPLAGLCVDYDRPFTGLMDDFALYRERALTASEILDLANGATPDQIHPEYLMIHYGFDSLVHHPDHPGLQMVTDLSGNGLHGYVNPALCPSDKYLPGASFFLGPEAIQNTVKGHSGGSVVDLPGEIHTPEDVMYYDPSKLLGPIGPWYFFINEETDVHKLHYDFTGYEYVGGDPAEPVHTFHRATYPVIAQYLYYPPMGVYLVHVSWIVDSFIQTDTFHTLPWGDQVPDPNGVPVVVPKDNFITGFEPMGGAGGIGQQVSQYKARLMHQSAEPEIWPVELPEEWMGTE